jgi:hypothetical protein
MRSIWIVRIFEIALVTAIVIAGFGQAVLQLWNLLMPGIFGLHTITYWQAVGLLALSWLLFGGPGLLRVRRGYPPHWRHRMAERLEHMPAEERDRFRQMMKRRCGPDAARSRSS